MKSAIFSNDRHPPSRSVCAEHEGVAFTTDTGQWSARRVVAKAEHLPKGANPRFMVTSLAREAVAAEELYETI